MEREVWAHDARTGAFTLTMSSLQNDLEDGSWRPLPKRFEGEAIQSGKPESRGFADWTNREARYRRIIVIDINHLILVLQTDAPLDGVARPQKPSWLALKFE